MQSVRSNSYADARNARKGVGGPSQILGLLKVRANPMRKHTVNPSACNTKFDWAIITTERKCLVCLAW